jgi:hypothetical protein
MQKVPILLMPMATVFAIIEPTVLFAREMEPVAREPASKNKTAQKNSKTAAAKGWAPSKSIAAQASVPVKLHRTRNNQ